MLKFRPRDAPGPRHEDLFVERYRWLYGWALQLTAHDHARAEDLVHDTFVQFVLQRKRLDSIENIDAYLYAMLRNTHFSERRRAGKLASAPLAAVDYDTAEVGLRTADPQRASQLRDELRAICSI